MEHAGGLAGGLLVGPDLDESTLTGRAIARARALYAPGTIRGTASAWSAWDAFADFHDFDPYGASDAEVVAFVWARVLVGVAYPTMLGHLGAIDVATGTPTVTRAARRALATCWSEGLFEPAAQAPVLTLGDVLAMDRAATDPLDRLLLRVGYRAALRPGEWRAIQYPDHVGVDRDGLVLVVPVAKSGPRRARLTVGLDLLDVGEAVEGWLKVRGEAPGPFVCDEGGPLSYGQVRARLRMLAAAAGIERFSPYSLRRSWAVHANLTGMPAADIQTHLGHAPDPDGQTWRRYVDPLLALQAADLVGAVEFWLDRTPRGSGPIPVSQVRGTQRPVRALAFADWPLEELLSRWEMPKLRVHPLLVNVSPDGLEASHQTRRRWAEWAQENGADPFGPDAWHLTEWLDHRIEVDGVLPTTARADLSRLRLAWIDATGSDEIPGWAQAHEIATGAVRQQLATRTPGRVSIRPLLADDRAALCAAAWESVVDPSIEWAACVLGHAVAATETVEVITVGGGAAEVLVDGALLREVQAVVPGVLDPVAAARVLEGVGPVDVPPGASEVLAIQLAVDRTESLRDALATVLVAGSGARPSDVARARASAVEQQPGGLMVRLAAVKGRGPGVTGRARILWAPDRSGVEDPVAAWEAWTGWWGPDGGPLLPANVTGPVDVDLPLTSRQVSKAIQAHIDAAGLVDINPYSARYGRATEMHHDGYRLATIAEALGHERTSTTLSYVVGYDPDADGWAGKSADFLAKALEAHEETINNNNEGAVSE